MLDNKISSYTYDVPIKYKSLTIYPVKMIDYFDFFSCVGCLLIDKNSTPDPRIISMSYFDFIKYSYDEFSKQGVHFPPIHELDFLLRICLHLDRSATVSPIEYGTYKGKNVFRIDSEIFYSSDFDEIRTIILEQNDIEIPDYTIKKEIRDELDLAKEMKSSGVKSCDIEEQMICLSIDMGWMLETIYDMTFRKYKKYIRRMDEKLHYKIYKAAAMSGFVTFKDDTFPKHWMRDLNEDNKYSDVLIPLDDVENKFNQ